MSEQLVPGIRRSQSRKILQSSSMRVAAAADPAVEEFNYERPLVVKKKKEGDSITTCSSSSSNQDIDDFVPNNRGGNYAKRAGSSLGAMLRSLVKSMLPAVPSCRWLALVQPAAATAAGAGARRPARHLGRRVTGTLFGQRKGHVSFAVQDDPRSEPVLLLELATPTSSLVKEMASGLVRIALECERGGGGGGGGGAKQQQQQLFHEPVWTMYCNGRKSGYAVSRACGDGDRHLLRTVETVSIGAGVIPAPATEKFAVAGGGGGGGELMYMRARFERVVGSRDSEAFYMMNPDGNGGPELSIFLLRI